MDEDRFRDEDEVNPAPVSKGASPPFAPDYRLVSLLEQGPRDDPERLFRKAVERLDRASGRRRR